MDFRFIYIFPRQPFLIRLRIKILENLCFTNSKNYEINFDRPGIYALLRLYLELLLGKRA